MDALALVEAPDHVCCRYRIAPFARRAEAAGHRLSVQALAHAPLARLRQLASARRFDVVVLQRKLLARLELHWLRRHARRLVFDFDDAVFARDSYDPRGPDSPRRHARFTRTVRLADQVLAGNEFLAARAVLSGADPDRVTTLPTCVDPSAYPARFHPPDDGQIRLVWIGSSSTVSGLENRRDLWARLGEHLPNVRLRLICDRFPDLGLPTESVPWSESTEAAVLAESDIGIAWVPDDLWSRGKCGLKVLQYLAAGLPAVANPVGVHVDMIEHERNGFLPGSDDAWIRAIGRLAQDPELRRRMGAAGRAMAECRYAVEAWADRWADAVFPPAFAISRPHGHNANDAATPHRRRTRRHPSRGA